MRIALAAEQIALSTDLTIRHQLAAARDIFAHGRGKFLLSSYSRISGSFPTDNPRSARVSHLPVKRLVESGASRDVSRVTLPIIRSRKIKYHVTRPDPFEVTLLARVARYRYSHRGNGRRK
jgi:hypothetical protein